MKKPTLVRLLGFIRPYMGFLFAALLFAVLNVSLTLYAPILTGRAIDMLLGKGSVNFSGIAQILIVLAFVILFAALFQYLMTLCTNHLAYKTVNRLRSRAFAKIQHMPLGPLDSGTHGDYISRITTDIEQVSDGLLQGFSQLFTGVITILGTIGFMLSLSVKITLVVVLVTPLSLFVSAFIAKRCYDRFREQSLERGKLAGFAEEMISQHADIKAFCYELEAEQQFEEINQRLYKCGWQAQFYSALVNPSTRFVNSVVYAAVGITGALAAVRGLLSVGQLTSFLTYANQYTKPFNEISGVVTELQSALASAGRVFELLDMPNEAPDSGDAVVLAHVHGNVQFKNVAFSYQKDTPFITQLSLSAAAGQRIAIVGPTGCGKTTIINLLMRFYDVDSGEILIDGIPMKQIARNSLRSMFGMVLQDTWVFSGSVHDNIAYGKPGASRQEVIDAAKSAHAHSFIRRLPKGYDTVISEDGANISQGQKQLLCIARIMLTRPPMLILDEATSSIDTRTEARIQRAFSEMMHSRTSFVVAHRLSTIQEADCILVMKDGKIVELGTHHTLLEKNGFYHRLYHAQFEKTGSSISKTPPFN